MTCTKFQRKSVCFEVEFPIILIFLSDRNCQGGEMKRREKNGHCEVFLASGVFFILGLVCFILNFTNMVKAFLLLFNFFLFDHSEQVEAM